MKNTKTPEAELTRRPQSDNPAASAVTLRRKPKKGPDRPASRWQREVSRLRRWVTRAFALGLALLMGWIIAYGFVPVPTTAHMIGEGRRMGSVRYTWVDMSEISVHLQRAAVAAEDANFCLHWGFDMAAIRDAIVAGATRGGSTISQQTVKNAFLWHGRSWPRKAMEAAITPVVELIWSKRRILEVYLNIAEFGPGIFGAEAAARHHFGVSAADLTARQAALLAAVLPNPRDRNASAPTDQLRARAGAIADGAATIAADGRDSCFAN